MSDATLSTVLFDLDGTLLDSIDLIVYSYRHTLETHLGAAPPDRVFLKGLGIPLHKMFHSFTDDPAEIEAMVETYRAHNEEHHDGMVEPYAGAPEVVRTAAAQGKKLGLVTSKSRRVCERGLEIGGFEGAFQVVVAAEDVVHHKPDPEPVLKALDGLGSHPADAVFIGDSPFDLEAGRRAGVRTAAALWGPFPRPELEPHTPDFWLRRPQDILALLGEIGEIGDGHLNS